MQHRMKRYAVLLLAVLLAFGAQTFAVGVIVDPEGVFDQGQAQMMLAQGTGSAEAYAIAAQTFESIPAYPESVNYAKYCRGMAALLESDALELEGKLSSAKSRIRDALEAFIYISGFSFLESEDLVKYCKARETEYDGLYSAAEERYAAILSVRDSMSRKEKMNAVRHGEIVIIPEEKVETLPPVLQGVPAEATQTLTLYTGPGKEFAKEKSVKVNSESQGLYIIGKCDNYYQLEYVSEGQKLRFWANTSRVKYRGGIIPACGEVKKEPTVLSETVACYGPGVDYAVFGFTVPAGVRVQAYETEGAFTMIRIKPDGAEKPSMVWVLSSALSY